MPDLSITQLPADATPVGADLVVTAKSPFGSGSNRKVTLTDLASVVGASALSAVLGVGNTTGGTDIEITSGDAVNSTAANLLLSTTTSGDIRLFTATNGRVDMNQTAVDVGTTTIGLDTSLTVTNTGVNAFTHIGQQSVLTKSDAFAQTGQFLGHFMQITNSGLGTMTTATGYDSNITATGAGSIISDARGFLMIGNAIGGGVITKYVGVNVAISNVSDAYFVEFEDTEMISSQSIKIIDNTTNRFLPMSTAVDGITLAATNLTLATTTSGDIILTPATTSDAVDINGLIDADVTLGDIVANEITYDFRTFTGTTINNAFQFRGADFAVQHDTAFDLTGTIGMIGVSGTALHAGASTVANAVGMVSQVVTNNAAATLTNGTGLLLIGRDTLGAITTYQGIDFSIGQAVTNIAMEFDTAFTTSGTAVNVSEDDVARFLPLSTASTGITFDSTDVVIQTTTNGDIILDTALNTDFVDINGRIDQDETYADIGSNTISNRFTQTITPTVNNANQFVGARYEVIKTGAFNLTAASSTLIAQDIQAFNQDSGDVVEMVMWNGNMGNQSSGTVTQMTGARFFTSNSGGGTVTDFVGIDFSTAAATTVNAFDFDTDFITTNAANVLENGAQRFFPFSTAATGLTFAAATLTLATTTSGDVSLSSADEILFTDANKAASGYAGLFKLSETSTEWNTFETNFGEVSLLNAINQTAPGTQSIGLDRAKMSLGGANDPGTRLTNVSNMFFFSSGSDDEVFSAVEMPPNYDDGTDITIHFVWSPQDGSAGDVIWAVESKIVDPNNSEVITGATVTQTVTDSTTSTADELLQTADITVSGTTLASGEILYLRLFRNGSAGGDTYGDDANLSVVDIQYTADIN